MVNIKGHGSANVVGLTSIKGIFLWLGRIREISTGLFGQPAMTKDAHTLKRAKDMMFKYKIQQVCQLSDLDAFPHNADAVRQAAVSYSSSSHVPSMPH